MLREVALERYHYPNNIGEEGQIQDYPIEEEMLEVPRPSGRINVAGTHAEMASFRRSQQPPPPQNNNVPPPPPPPSNDTETTGNNPPPRRTSRRRALPTASNRGLNNTTAAAAPQPQPHDGDHYSGPLTEVEVRVRIDGDIFDNDGVGSIEAILPDFVHERIQGEEEDGDEEGEGGEEEEEGEEEGSTTARTRSGNTTARRIWSYRPTRTVGRQNAEPPLPILPGDAPPAVDAVQANVPPAPAQNIDPVAAQVLAAIEGGDAGMALGNEEGARVAEACGFNEGSFIKRFSDVVSGDIKLSQVRMHIALGDQDGNPCGSAETVGLTVAYDIATKDGMEINYLHLYRELHEGPAALELANQAGFVDRRGESLSVMLIQHIDPGRGNEEREKWYTWDSRGTLHRTVEDAANEMGVFIGSIRIPYVVDMLQNARGYGLPPGTLKKTRRSPDGYERQTYVLPPDAEEGTILTGRLPNVAEAAGIMLDNDTLAACYNSLKNSLSQVTGMGQTRHARGIQNVINRWTDEKVNLPAADLSTMKFGKWGPSKVITVTYFFRCHEETFPLIIHEFREKIGNNEAALETLQTALPDLGSRTE